MFLNILLLIIIVISIILLYLQIKRVDIDKQILPNCNFVIGNVKYEIKDTIRIAKYSVYSRNKDRYFRDFPISFKFYSEKKFRSKIKITYVLSGDDEIEVIYDRIVEFDNDTKEHIYYINDVIVGSIDVEIYTDSYYGIPTIEFEILQSNKCHMSKQQKIEIKFPL